MQKITLFNIPQDEKEKILQTIDDEDTLNSIVEEKAWNIVCDKLTKNEIEKVVLCVDSLQDIKVKLQEISILIKFPIELLFVISKGSEVFKIDLNVFLSENKFENIDFTVILESKL